MIPAIIDGVKSSNANTALDSDFGAKAARDHVVYQHSHSNMLLFVPTREYQPTFTITLVDQISNQPKLLRVSATR